MSTKRIPLFNRGDELHERIKELWQDGYVTIVGQQWTLTDLGWRVLCACADKRAARPFPRKENA